MLLLLSFPASSGQSTLVGWASHRKAAFLNVEVIRTWLFTLVSFCSSSLLPYLWNFHPSQHWNSSTVQFLSREQKLLSSTTNILVSNRLAYYFFHCYLPFQRIFYRVTPKGISLSQLNCRYHVPWSINYSWRGEEVGGGPFQSPWHHSNLATSCSTYKSPDLLTVVCLRVLTFALPSFTTHPQKMIPNVPSQVSSFFTKLRKNCPRWSVDGCVSV